MVEARRAGADLQQFMVLAAAALKARYVALATPADKGWELESSRGRATLGQLPLPVHTVQAVKRPVPSPSPFPDCPEAQVCLVVSLPGDVPAVLYVIDSRDVGAVMLPLVVDQLRVYLEHWDYPLFRANPNPMWVIDLATHRFLAVNDAAVDQYGYTFKEFLGMRIGDMYPGEDADQLDLLERLFDLNDKLEQDRIVQWGESRHRTRDGSVINVEVSCTPVRFRGRAAGLVCPRNVTMQKQAEEALRDSENRFRRLTEATFEGILIHTDGKVLEANEGAARIFGYDDDGMVGLPIMELVAPESQRMVISRISQRDETRTDFVARRRDGSRFMAEAISRNHVYRNQLYRLVAVRDISHIRRAETALRASEERFRAVFTRSGIGIALLNEEGRALQCNDALCRILGTSEDDIVGRTARQFTMPEDIPDVVTLFDELRCGARDEFRRDRPFRRQDGSLGWAHVTVSAVRDSGGHLNFAVCMVEDVSQRKADEEERRRLEEQLLQSQKVEAIGRLAGGVAHDFNNLLTSVQCYADLLRNELGDNPTLSHFAEEIIKTSEEAAGLTRRLLAFSRKTSLLAVPVNVNEVVEDMEEILQPLLPGNVTLRLLTAPDAGTIMADPVQIKQVILNLVVNARDAMPDGGVVTLQSMRVNLDGTERVCVRVRDEGVGMTDDVKAHLFEPFFTTKPHGKGTGLGLATCYGIIKQSQGWFEIDSRPGGGSTFSVFLPRLGDAEPAVKPVPPPPSRRGDETVLVVEDARPLRELVAHVLCNLGYSILVASDGEEAVGLLASRPEVRIDLLLTDVLMPEMGGEELARWVTARSPETRVLYMSGHNEVPGLQRGDLAPGVALLSKPFTPSGLAEAVRTVLDEAPVS